MECFIPAKRTSQCRLRSRALDHPGREKEAQVTYQPFDLTGKFALVTGGNRGIGLGIAQAVAEAGADVAIWGTNADKNAEARAELARTGRRVVALQCDVGDEAAVDAAFAKTLEALG